MRRAISDGRPYRNSYFLVNGHIWSMESAKKDDRVDRIRVVTPNEVAQFLVEKVVNVKEHYNTD